MTERYKNVLEQMKLEFFGIDKQIEEILSSIEAWEVTKDFIIRPNIFNIVGLTGVGKTAVVNRIMDLLGLKDKVVYLKFNNRTTDVIETLKSNNISDSIFLFDEFQYLRTKNEKGEENKDEDYKGFNIIWDLLDNGEITLQRYNSEYFGLYKILSVLDDFIKYNIKYNRGIFTFDNFVSLCKKHDIYLESIEALNAFKEALNSGEYDILDSPVTNNPINNTNGNYRKDLDAFSSYSKFGMINSRSYFPDSRITIGTDGKLETPSLVNNELSINSIISSSYYNLLNGINSISDKFNFKDERELKSFLFNIKSTQELYDFFKQFEKSKPVPIIKTFKNSLIITISNIDEAYRMANNVDSDLDADYFYKHTTKINILDIRKALLERFRAEQIARFGSNYILYPSLNKESFEKIINKELNDFNNLVKTKFNGENDLAKVSEVTYSNEIRDLIYKEGVFPIIGARSVFSTVISIISDKLSIIIKSILDLSGKFDNIRIMFDYNKRNTNIIIKYIDSNGNIIHEDTIKYNLKVDNLRREDNKNIGKQAHRAVHEAGHAVCSVVLMNILPETVYSTVIGSNGAFNMFSNTDFYYNRKNTYMNHIATLMGGYVAESIVFGDENVSDGSSSDLSEVTSKLNRLYKDCGFGSKIGRFVSKQMPHGGFEDRNYSIIDDNEIDKEIQEKIVSGFNIAKQTLTEQRVLMIKLSEYLIKNPKIGRNKIKDFVKKYVVNYDIKQLDVNPTAFYLDMVNTEIEKLK